MCFETVRPFFPLDDGPGEQMAVCEGFVKKGKRGACKQKAATVLPDRTAATYYIFEFDIV